MQLTKQAASNSRNHSQPRHVDGDKGGQGGIGTQAIDMVANANGSPMMCPE